MTAAKTENKTTAKPRAAKATSGFEAFAMPKVEMPAALREMTEMGLSQTHDTYDKIKQVAEEATDLMEDNYESTRQGVVEFNMRALDAAKANTDATYDFFRSMFGVKSLSEAIELQTSFARGQFDAMSVQAKDLQELSSKVATELGEPMKDAFGKAFKDFKAA